MEKGRQGCVVIQGLRATAIRLIFRTCSQGHNEVRWRPGQEASLAPPTFEPEVFRKQMHCVDKSSCDIIGIFRRPRSDLASGELRPPCPPRYAPACSTTTETRTTVKYKVFPISMERKI